MALETILYLSVILPFLLAAVMPSGRWLAGYGLVVAGLLVWLDWYQQKHSPDDWGVDVFIFHVFVSLVAGLLARSLSLLLRNMPDRPWAAHLPLFVGFGVLLAPFIWLWEMKPALERRPPSEACRSKVFELEMAGAVYTIPAGAPFEVYYYDGEVWRDYSLSYDRELRKFCAAVEGKPSPLPVVNIKVQFYRLGSITEEDRLCKLPEVRNWTEEFCRNRPGPEGPYYPYWAIISNPGTDDSRASSAMNSSRPRSYYEYFESHLDLARGEGASIEVDRFEVFDHFILDFGSHQSHHLVSHDPDKTTPDGQPFALKCSYTDVGYFAGKSGCETYYQLDDRTFVRYYVAPEPLADIRAGIFAVDANLANFVERLRSNAELDDD